MPGAGCSCGCSSWPALPGVAAASTEAVSADLTRERQIDRAAARALWDLHLSGLLWDISSALAAQGHSDMSHLWFLEHMAPEWSWSGPGLWSRLGVSCMSCSGQGPELQGEARRASNSRKNEGEIERVFEENLHTKKGTRKAGDLGHMASRGQVPQWRRLGAVDSWK